MVDACFLITGSCIYIIWWN